MMIKTIKYFFIILIFTLPITWLSNHPGEVKIIWKNYFIETNVLGILLITFLFCFLVLLTYIVYNKIKEFPKVYKNFKKDRNFSLGNKALTSFTQAIVDGSQNNLDVNARKIKKYFNNSIFSGYFLAQNAITNNDFLKAKKYLNVLKNTPEGQFIRIKGLSVIAMKEKKNDEALKYLKEAKRIEPKNLWVCDNLSLLLAKCGKWEEAALVLNNIDNDLRIKNNRACFLIQSGKNPIDAWKISSDIIPVAIKAIEYYLELNDEKAAFLILKKSWKNLQYTKMIDIFMNKNNTSNKISLRRFKLVFKALKSAIEYDETKLAMAVASFNTSLWAETKKYLELIKKDKWDKRVIDLWKLLSLETKKIEIPDFPEKIKDEPKWKCSNCGYETFEWNISCDNCGDIGKIVWPKSRIQYEKKSFIEIN